MKRDIDLYISDIIESIDTIQSRVNGLSEEKFKQDGEKYESIVYRFATIGEAVNKLPKSERDKFPNIDWPAIISMRNILIHEYYEVDLNISWDTIQNDLEKLLVLLVQEKIRKTDR